MRMASPGVYGSSLVNNAGPGSLGGQSQLPVETAIDRNWHFDQGQHKAKCRKDTAEFLEQSLQALAKSREPAEHDGVARQATIGRLQDLLRDPNVFPPPCQLQLVPYGSFQSTCYSRSSDLDLALTGWVSETVLGRHASASRRAVPLEQLERNDCRLILLRLAGALEIRRLTKGPVDRNPLEARVPIIKFEEVNSGIECDLCVTTRGCDFKASIMRLLHGLQPSLAPLIQLVKVWAKHHDINSAHCATFNSWSLALMVMFSLQCFPDGHLLPPLWKIFHNEEPTGPGGKGRPLQDKDLPLDVMMLAAQGRCLDEANRLMAAVWANTAQPALLEQLLWFFSCFATILCKWRDNAAHRNWRVSTWLGRGLVARFPKAYLAPVEEPFDCNDNTARSLGIKDRHEQTLPYVAWVFSHSVHLLRNVATVEDAARALVWLFGTEALPCVGLQRLKLPPAVIPEIVMLRLEKMAGVQGAGNGEAQAEEAQADTAREEYEKHMVLRSVIDTTKVGSPIMSLSDWRHYTYSVMGHQCAPYAWHPLFMPSQPPPRMIASPQSSLSAAGFTNHDIRVGNGQEERLANGFGASGAAGMGGGIGGVPCMSEGFGGFMAAGGGGGFGASPEPFVPVQWQHQHQHVALQETMQHQMQHSLLQQPILASVHSSLQHSMHQSMLHSMQQSIQQQQQRSSSGISVPGPVEGPSLNTGFGAMAGQALLEALRTGSSKDKAMAAATGARSPVAGIAGVAHGSTISDASVAGSDGISAYDAVIAAPAPKPQGQSPFSSQQSRPVSVFSFYSGMQQHQEQQQKQQLEPQQRVAIEGPSVSSPFSLSMSMTASAASQLLLSEPSLPMTQPPPPVPPPPEQQHQPLPELKEILRLLSVSPTSHSANMGPSPPPPQNVLPSGPMRFKPPQPSSVTTSNGAYQVGQQLQAKAAYQPEAFQSSNTNAALDAFLAAGSHQSSTYHRPDEGRPPSYNPFAGLQASSQQSQWVFPPPKSALMLSPQSSRQEEQQEQQPARQQLLQNPSFAGPPGLGLPLPSAYTLRSAVGAQCEGASRGNGGPVIGSAAPGASRGHRRPPGF